MNYNLTFIKKLFAFILIIFVFIGAFLFYQKDFQYWSLYYYSTVFITIIYLYKNIPFCYFFSFLFIIFQLIGITFSVIPFLYFDLELEGLNKALFLHSLSLCFTVAINILFFSKYRVKLTVKNSLFDTPAWSKFILINKRIFYFTLPFVFLAMYFSNGWKSFFGIEGYDRVASMKGMGFLMIFSVINVGSAIFLVLNNFYKKNYLNILFPLFSILVINGFTQGRNNLIWLIFTAFFVLGVFNKINKKTIIYFFFLGLLIVFYKIMRYNPNENQFSLLLTFFLNFTGDFDVVIRTTNLLNYIEKNDFFGLYHIWSQLLVYLPRTIFPDKPQILGNLYLNALVFPGVYTGGIGSTGFTFGVISVLYSITGISFALLLLFLSCFVFIKFDNYIYKEIVNKRLSIFFVIYFFLLQNVIIYYREWSTGITNILLYSFIYIFFYTIFKFNWTKG
ncbi:hypothetical protein CPU12_11450 [Malaciobacter molluscorum LMG 25693]|uniref:Membrane protein n=1 Tax=Malaciobacter molluscorum LMG 25693 TaxID=870501 RepID=A0A2G1DFC3_9BACT|nr:O-antigen polymerase [Malaciobacter molluscorum]AXX91795.1 putative membrane protein [Malaciobacter molluscorum LMG 25693]PHO17212.1 hypothetical protein CPU12_11450 [Malaciobacter molluscorum LMG 25693]